jgi:hypothetical protein
VAVDSWSASGGNLTAKLDALCLGKDKIALKTFSCPSKDMHRGGFPTLKIPVLSQLTGTIGFTLLKTYATLASKTNLRKIKLLHLGCPLTLNGVFFNFLLGVCLFKGNSSFQPRIDEERQNFHLSDWTG